MEGPGVSEGGEKARTESRRAGENLQKEQWGPGPPAPSSLALPLLQDFFEEH